MEVKRLVKELAFKDGLLGKHRADSLHHKLLPPDAPDFNQSQPKSVKTWKARNHKLASTGNLYKAPAPPAHGSDFFRIEAPEKPRNDGCHIFKSNKTKLVATSKGKAGTTHPDTSHSRARTIKVESKLVAGKAGKDTPQRPVSNFADFERNQRSHSAPQRNSSDGKKPYYLAVSLAAQHAEDEHKLEITLKEPSFSHGTSR